MATVAVTLDEREFRLFLKWKNSPEQIEKELFDITPEFVLSECRVQMAEENKILTAKIESLKIEIEEIRKQLNETPYKQHNPM